MITKVTHVTVWVKDQDEALKFYRDKLGFKVITDDATTVSNYSWLTVAPQQHEEMVMALNLATTPGQLAGVGRQGVYIRASTDVHADYAVLKKKGVKIQTDVNVNPWGSDFIFEDLYGNDLDVVQPPAS